MSISGDQSSPAHVTANQAARFGRMPFLVSTIRPADSNSRRARIMVSLLHQPRFLMYRIVQTRRPLLLPDSCRAMSSNKRAADAGKLRNAGESKTT
jgi:hypothetical protein